MEGGFEFCGSLGFVFGWGWGKKLGMGKAIWGDVGERGYVRVVYWSTFYVYSMMILYLSYQRLPRLLPPP